MHQEEWATSLQQRRKMTRYHGMAVMVSDIRSRVHACLHALAECHDDVTNSTHAGFNRLDAFFGCELAETSHLSLAQAVGGALPFCRDPRQLQGRGITAPDGGGSLRSGNRAQCVVTGEERALRPGLAGA